jgi:SAM-dependent methyltransferase
MARETETPEEERPGAGPGPAEDDHWSGSDRVVQVRPHVWRWLAARIGDGPVLEIGPGLRPTAPARSSTFVDASAHALRRLAAQGARTVPVDGNLPFLDREFEAVLAFEVVEHVEEDEALLAEMARVTRPGGLLILSTPVHRSMWSPLDEACGHVRRDEPDTVFGKVTEAGYEVGGFTWFPASSRRVIRIRARTLRRYRRLSTAVVQSLVFPFQAAYHRWFGRVSWKAPASAVPAEADDLMLWARRSAEP